MWTVTVKTLDSQNHKFDNVDPTQTVAEFKSGIAEKVKVEASRQRLIFCGRVLQDNQKLNDYDVSGRVIHLVQRLPPGANQGPDRVAESEARASSRGPSPSPRGRIEHIHVHTQDIPFPQFLSSPSGTVGHSSPLVRLNVAREMLVQSNRNLDRLDNPSAARDEADLPGANISEPDVESPLGEHVHGEMGFAAGPIHIEMMSIPVTADGAVVGGAGAQPGFAEALSAMFTGMGPRPGQGGSPRRMSFRFENGVMVPNNGTPGAATGNGGAASPASSTANTSATGASSTPSQTTDAPTASTSTPLLASGATGASSSTPSAASVASPSETSSATPTGVSGSTPPGASGSTPPGASGSTPPGASGSTPPGATVPPTGADGEGAGSGLRIRHPPPEVLAEVLEEYQRTNARLVVHQNNLIPLLRADAVYSEEETNVHQTMFNLVSQTTHFLSHAQHAMSDIMLNFSRPPPRQLRARLFVIPSIVHSARVHAGPVISVTAGESARGTSRTSTSTNTSTNTSTSTSAPAPTASVSSATSTSTTSSTARQRTARMSTGGRAPGGASFTVRATPHPEQMTNGIHTLVQNALQQAFRSVPTSTSSTPGRRGSTPGVPSTGANTSGSSATRPQMGHFNIPLTPQIASMGNMNSFDPFLQCSSHHIPNNRSPLGARVSSRTRPGRSEPGSAGASRTSSLDRRSTINRARTAPSLGSSWITSGTTSSTPLNISLGGLSGTAGLSGVAGVPGVPVLDAQNIPVELADIGNIFSQIFGGSTESPNQDDMNVMNVVQGIMGQVISSLGGQQESRTIAEFLNTLPDYNYVEGESLITDLLMTLAQHMNFNDLMGVVGRNPSSYGGLQAPLQRFIRQRILEGKEATRENLQSCLINIMDEWYPEMENAMSAVNVRDDIVYSETAHRFLSDRPMDLLNLIMEEDNQSFQARVGPLLRLITAEGTALSLHCFSDGQESLERLVQNRLGALAHDIGPMIRQWTMGSAINHLRGIVTGVHVELDEVRRFIVRRESMEQYAAARASRQAGRAPVPDSGSQMEVRTMGSLATMEVDQDEFPVEDAPMVSMEVPIIPENGAVPTFPTSLLNVPLEVGETDAEGWQGAVPPEWVPIISRDSRQVAPRPLPYSDAYISGQPSKRRRLNNEKKPRGDTINLISETLEEAVESSGVSPVRGLDNLLSSASSSSLLQDAVQDLTTDTIQERLEKDPDFAPERYPSAKQFIKKNK